MDIQTIKKYILFISGLLFIFPILNYISIMDLLIKVLQLLLLIIAIFEWRKTKEINFNFLVLYFSMFLFYWLSGYYLDEYIFISNFRGLIMPFYMVLLSVFYKPTIDDMNTYISGLKLGSLVNVIWGGLELFVFNISGVLLNQEVFSNIAGGRNMYSNYNPYNNRLRPSGLGWDPYFYGFSSLILIIFSKNKILKCMGILGVIFSQSRISQIGLIVYFLYNIFSLMKKIKDKKLYLRIRNILFACVLVSIICGIIFMVNNISGAGDMRRFYYYITPFTMKTRMGPLNILFGGSPIYSGTVYMLYPDLLQKLSITWDASVLWTVESDWVSILVGRGFVGVIMYLILFKKLINYSKGYLIHVLFIIIFVMGFGYLYEVWTPILLLYIFAFNINSQDKKENKYLHNKLESFLIIRNYIKSRIKKI